MMNILKEHHGMNIIGQGWRIILFTLPSLIAAVLLHLRLPEFSGFPGSTGFLKPLGYVLLLLGALFWGTAVIQLLSAFTKGSLVTTGAYGVARNPIYSSVTFFVLPGVALMTSTWVYCLVSVFLYIGVRIFIGKEEEQLSTVFGKQYEDYKATVHRMLPVRHGIESLVRVILLASICYLLWWASVVSVPNEMNLYVFVGGTLLVVPVSWIARKILDRNPRAVTWITMAVHFIVVLLAGVPIVRAFVTHQQWSDGNLPIPPEIGLILVIVTGAVCFVTVANLALKGLGAPGIVFSRRLAVDWLYAWTRNPMVLAALAWLLSLGIWFRSLLFVLWVLFLFAPALLFYVKVYEERELEIRFGPSYLEYKSRTPMLVPRRPGT